MRPCGDVVRVGEIGCGGNRTVTSYWVVGLGHDEVDMSLYRNNTILIVSLEIFDVVRTFEGPHIYGRPMGMVACEAVDGSPYLLVCCSESNNVLFLDTTTAGVVRPPLKFPNPYGVAAFQIP